MNTAFGLCNNDVDVDDDDDDDDDDATVCKVP